MMNLNQISIDLDSRTAWVESGATLGEMYYAISQASSSLSFPAGCCPAVGIGGHFSCGGYGLMTRKYGLSAENVIDALLVSRTGHVFRLRSNGRRCVRSGQFEVVVEVFRVFVYAGKIQLVPIPAIITAFKFSRNDMKN
ncbi:Reticuline oxidase [Thalictrum thalictroides]|uniref:Reticuline oxidase n=1 Tax=Thalictrum thalictroides TaxID=46969 RepID=A0A7J6WDG3_THATH|nr:Reticuline oxidase [Thalictrum thalictroides]